MVELWVENRKLVAYFSKRYLKVRGRSYDADDLMQAGYIGLHLATRLYDPDRGMSFSSYAAFYIQNEMQETAGLRGYGSKDATNYSLSLDASVIDDDELTLLDILPAPQEECPVEREDLARIVRAAVDRIQNSAVREAICAVYWDGKAVVEYAEAVGICNQWASERLQQGCAILRKDPAIISLTLAWGYDTEYYRYKGLSNFKRTRTSTVEDEIISQERKDQLLDSLRRQLGPLADISLS